MGAKGLVKSLRVAGLAPELLLADAPSSFLGETLAFDGSGILYSCVPNGDVETIATLQREGNSIPSYLLTGIASAAAAKVLRIANALNAIDIVVVLDGDTKQKSRANRDRSDKRKNHFERGCKKRDEGDHVAARNSFASAIKATDDEFTNAFARELAQLKIKVEQASHEADGHLAYLSIHQGMIPVGRDGDFIILGCESTIQLNAKGDAGSFVVLKDVFGDKRSPFFGLDCKDLAIVWTVNGCDYCSGIEGVGDKTALKAIKQLKKSSVKVTVESLTSKLCEMKPKLLIPDGFLDEANMSVNTFLYQLVIDRTSKSIVHLNEPPSDIAADLDFLGNVGGDPDVNARILTRELNYDGLHFDQALGEPYIPPALDAINASTDRIANRHGTEQQRQELRRWGNERLANAKKERLSRNPNDPVEHARRYYEDRGSGFTRTFLVNAQKTWPQGEIHQLVDSLELSLLSLLQNEMGQDDVLYICKYAVDSTGLPKSNEDTGWLTRGQTLLVNVGGGEGELIRKSSLHRVGTDLPDGVGESELIHFESFRIVEELDESTAFYVESRLIELGNQILPLGRGMNKQPYGNLTGSSSFDHGVGVVIVRDVIPKLRSGCLAINACQGQSALALFSANLSPLMGTSGLCFAKTKNKLQQEETQKRKVEEKKRKAEEKKREADEKKKQRRMTIQREMEEQEGEVDWKMLDARTILGDGDKK